MKRVPGDELTGTSDANLALALGMVRMRSSSPVWSTCHDMAQTQFDNRREHAFVVCIMLS